ncbi:MAG: protein kinase, partial [Deltaproteobacteria bacterium]|nr:protein kinase [Deltaproteobacteria bacterium]
MQRVGRYQLVRKLASRGLAEVYLAEAEGPGRPEKSLVLKRILAPFAEQEAFSAEARIAAQLGHPNLAQVLDFGEAEGSYYVAMEHVDGLSLRQLIRWSMLEEQPLPHTLVARILSLSCEGLAYAHEFADPDPGQE